MTTTTSYPQDLRYTKDHEWIRLQGDRGRVGITDHAQNQLGEIVFLELHPAGTKLKAGAQFGTVESVKSVSELFSPVAGEVVEVNEALVKKPETINTDPYGESWMVVIKLDDPSAAAALLDAAAYRALVENQ